MIGRLISALPEDTEDTSPLQIKGAEEKEKGRCTGPDFERGAVMGRWGTKDSSVDDQAVEFHEGFNMFRH